MLLKIAEQASIFDNLKYPQRAKVVKNDDPKKLGRVKVTIKGIMEGKGSPVTKYSSDKEKERLPWIYPLCSSGLGGKVDCSSFGVPELDSELVVVFPYGNTYRDIYHGFYVGYWRSDLTHQGVLFNEDYPDTYGSVDSQTQWIRINKNQNYTEFFRILTNKQNYSVNLSKPDPDPPDSPPGTPPNKGVLIRVDKDENVLIHHFGDMTWQTEGNFYMQVKKNFDIDVGEHMTIRTGKDFDVDAGKDIGLDASVNQIHTAGNNFGTNAGNNIVEDAGNTISETSGTLITSESAHIDHNSQTNLPKLPKIVTVTEQMPILEAKIVELQAKLAALTAEANALKSEVDSEKKNIAKV